MFAKLLKYEWKANSRLLLMLSGCILGIGCINAVILRLLSTNWDSIAVRDEIALILFPVGLFLYFSCLALVLYPVCILFILLYRFYKSRFTDEGYLIFTLPVKTSHIFLSNAVHMLIWFGICLAVIALSLVIAVVIGPVWSDGVLDDFRLFFQNYAGLFVELKTPLYAVSSVFRGIIGLLFVITVPMTAIVLGSVATKSNKVLAIAGILIGICILTGTANGIVSTIMELLILAFETQRTQITGLLPLISSIVPLILTVFGYFLSVHFMKNRLNLP